jgi:hypothetical protein
MPQNCMQTSAPCTASAFDRSMFIVTCREVHQRFRFRTTQCAFKAILYRTRRTLDVCDQPGVKRFGEFRKRHKAAFSMGRAHKRKYHQAAAATRENLDSFYSLLRAG